jgi:hypothetical protein
MQGQFESLTPLLMYHHKHLTPQTATDRAATMIHESYHRFEDTEQRLYRDVDAESLPVIKAYLRAYKDIIMCNLH